MVGETLVCVDSMPELCVHIGSVFANGLSYPSKTSKIRIKPLTLALLF